MTDPSRTPTDPAQTAREIIARALEPFSPSGQFEDMSIPAMRALTSIYADGIVASLHTAGYTIVPISPSGTVTVSRETLQALYEGRAAGTLVPFDVLDDVARALRAALAAAGFAITKRESASAGTGPDR